MSSAGQCHGWVTGKDGLFCAGTETLRTTKALLKSSIRESKGRDSHKAKCGGDVIAEKVQYG